MEEYTMAQLNRSENIFLDRESYEIAEQTLRTSSRRGFAAMDQRRQREIASKGGRTAHAKGTAHEFSSEEAAAAGRKGGHAAHAKGTAHEFSSEEAAAAGRKGGRASHTSTSRSDIVGPIPEPVKIMG
jgi:general stress protein YciG